ncbi:MAG: ATP-binding protein [Candidatus Omnitrophota bacterium]
MKKRYLTPHVLADLKEKMVFVGGARQVGKTSLAQYIAKENFQMYDYLNWDSREDRKSILRSQFKGSAEIVLFDEIHKYKDWKNYLKGQFDKHKDDFKILVTGSARMDIYRKGGDSLMGRYYYYRLHPFSVSEFLEKKNKITPFSEIDFGETDDRVYDASRILLKFGGFPEPLLKQSDKTLRRWHNQRLERLVKEDIRDLENVRDLSILQVLTDILPQKVGSLLSINSLREDLSAAHKTVAKWIEVLEKFYYHFRIYPFKDNKIRSLKKEPKLYLYDWSEIDDNEGVRLENMVASHLLKLCHYLNDADGYKTELYFLRDIEGREVDFLVTEGGKPWFAVEVKSSRKDVSQNLVYFGQRLKIPFLYQVVKERNVDIRKDAIRIISLDRFLVALV